MKPAVESVHVIFTDQWRDGLFNIRLRRALKCLLRSFGLKASWPRGTHQAALDATSPAEVPHETLERK